MPQNHPVHIRILQLLGRNLTGKGTRRLGECVLGRDLGGRVELGLDFEKVQGRGGDDDFVGAVEVGVVDGSDNLLDRLERAVHLKVTAVTGKSQRACFSFFPQQKLTRQRTFEPWWICVF